MLYLILWYNISVCVVICCVVLTCLYIILCHCMMWYDVFVYVVLCCVLCCFVICCFVLFTLSSRAKKLISTMCNFLNMSSQNDKQIFEVTVPAYTIMSLLEDAPKQPTKISTMKLKIQFFSQKSHQYQPYQWESCIVKKNYGSLLDKRNKLKPIYWLSYTKNYEKFESN